MTQPAADVQSSDSKTANEESAKKDNGKRNALPPKPTLADVPSADVKEAEEPPKREVPEKYRGTKTYRLGQPHYRGGRYYEAGETITVTDEVPSRTWEPVEVAGAKARAAAAAQKDGKGQKRASDEQI